MTDNYCWSQSFGRWMGVPVRVHVLLFLFLAVIFGVESQHKSIANELLIGTGTFTAFVVLISVLFHELSHVFAVTNLGGHVNNIVLTPWGGNSDLAMPDSHRGRFVVHMAGPFASGMVCAMSCAMLYQSHLGIDLTELIHPLQPHGFHASDGGRSALMIICWVNFQLMLVNLIPCFPFDGAGLLRSVINWINPDLPRVRSESTIMVIGHAVAFTMIGMAWIIRDYNSGPIQPAWFLLVLCGISLLFSARYSANRETSHTDVDWDELDELEYDSLYSEESSYFESGFDDEKTYSQWLQEKQAEREQEDERKQELIEKEEERRADEILKKLHSDGIDAISEEEKSLLNRVSERIRNRRQGV